MTENTPDKEGVECDPTAGVASKKKYPVQRGVECDPLMDGVTHINVWSRGRTKLGRQLTNMASIDTYVKGLGSFTSIEGLWWYAATGMTNPKFKVMNPFDARREGKKLPRVDNPRFEEIIKEGLTYKVKNHPELLAGLDQLTLPLCHYYVYGEPPDCKVHLANNSLWQLDHFIELPDSTKT